MPDVEKLEEEAEKKGLHGEEEKRYVGGVFNKIRQAHKKASPEKKKAAKGRIKEMVGKHTGKKQEAINKLKEEIAALEKEDEELINKAQAYYDKGKMQAYRKTMQAVQLAGVKRQRRQDELKGLEKTTEEKRREAQRKKQADIQARREYEEEKKIAERQEKERLEARIKDSNLDGYFVGEHEREIAKRHNEENQARRIEQYKRKYQ